MFLRFKKKKEEEETKKLTYENDNNKFQGIWLYWFLASLRVGLTFVPQTGYIQPDEFFQSVEVVAGDIFEFDVVKTWEFNASFPIRSIVIPYVVSGLPYMVVKAAAPTFKSTFGVEIITPYTLLVVPRLIVTLLSFLCDFSLYKCCLIYGQNYRVRLVTLASSYVMLIYGTRTFSNTIEMILASLLLYFVVDSMVHSEDIVEKDEFLSNRYNAAKTPGDRVRYNKLRKRLPYHSMRNCVALSVLTVIGIFNRPTFVAFAFAPLFFWLQRGLSSKQVGMSHFHMRMVGLLSAALTTGTVFVAVDSFYYGYLTWHEIREMKISYENFIATPWNFFQYNYQTDNLANHGLHPHYFHFLINVPLLFNVLGIIGLASFARLVYAMVFNEWKDRPRIQSMTGLMTASFVMPIFLLSIFPHQEPRFIIPIIVPLIFLHSQKVRTRETARNTLLTTWYSLNLISVIVYGFIHQAGVYPLALDLKSEIDAKPPGAIINVASSFTYMLPSFLLMIPSPNRDLFSSSGKRYRLSKQVFIHELWETSVDEAVEKIQSLLFDGQKRWDEKRQVSKTYLILPTSLETEFKEKSIAKFNSTILTKHFPHLTTEAFPKFDGMCETNQDNEVVCHSISQWLCSELYKFGLLLIQVER